MREQILEKGERGSVIMLEQLNDGDYGDWRQVFGEDGSENPQAPRKCLEFEGSDAPFTREDVVEIRHIQVGEGDGDHWRCVGKLKDGRWFYVDGWCDYTGWGCQDGAQAWVSDSYENLCRWGLGAPERELWGVSEWWKCILP